MFGKLILFGSGETSPAGKKIHRKIFQTFGIKQNIIILETPAGFQPNSKQVAEEIANVFRYSLAELVSDISVIPPTPSNLQPLHHATYIFLGPGSPTYTVRKLQNTRVWRLIVDHLKDGATLCLSSAAAIAMGEYTLPVYEIYKAGEDLHWKKGLNIFEEMGLSFSVVTHWNNREGGKQLDTRYCYMGEERFINLRKLLPKDAVILGIDEHTAIIFDFQNKVFSVEGVGGAILLKGRKSAAFGHRKYYSLDSFVSLVPRIVPPPKLIKTPEDDTKKIISKALLPKDLKTLLTKREQSRKEENFKEADKIRSIFGERGYLVEDTNKGQKVFKIQ